MVVNHGERFSFSPDESVAAASRRFLSTFIDAAAMSARRDSLLACFDRQSKYLGDRRCGGEVPVTFGSLFGTVLECSLAFGGESPEVRWTIDLVPAEDSRLDRERAARAYLEELSGELPRITEILQTLEPWWSQLECLHGVVSTSGPTTAHKLYLHGLHGGPERPFPWKEVLLALGATKLVGLLERQAAPGEQVCIIGLDLDSGPRARVKVYLKCRASRMDRLLDRYEPFAPDGSLSTIRAFRGKVKQGLDSLGAHEVLSLTTYQTDDLAVEQVTYSLPLVPQEVEPFDAADSELGSDAFFCRSVLAVLDEDDAEGRAAYARILDRLPLLSPADSYYFHTYLSYQERTRGVARVTVYFAPQLYAHRMEELQSLPRTLR